MFFSNRREVDRGGEGMLWLSLLQFFFVLIPATVSFQPEWRWMSRRQRGGGYWMFMSSENNKKEEKENCLSPLWESINRGRFECLWNRFPPSFCLSPPLTSLWTLPTPPFTESTLREANGTAKGVGAVLTFFTLFFVNLSFSNSLSLGLCSLFFLVLCAPASLLLSTILYIFTASFIWDFSKGMTAWHRGWSVGIKKREKERQFAICIFP